MVTITHRHGLVETAANMDTGALFAQRHGESCTIVQRGRRPGEVDRELVFEAGGLVSGEVSDETRAYWRHRLDTWERLPRPSRPEDPERADGQDEEAKP